VDDAEIIRASMRDPRAFGEIFERHYDDISRYARRRLGDEGGEEIASATFLIAFEQRSRFNPALPTARPWLFGIATNLVRHHARDERRHLEILARLPVPLSEPDVAEEPARLDALRQRTALHDALVDLAAADRDAFLLRALTDLTYPEIGRALGVREGTVKSRIHRARAALRERLTAVGAIDVWGADPQGERTTDG
jgi:RNA polymerase sigma-70 factor (ECF subfamily)